MTTFWPWADAHPVAAVVIVAILATMAALSTTNLAANFMSLLARRMYYRAVEARGWRQGGAEE